MSFTFNTPLSLLEQIDSRWIGLTREMVEAGKIELIGSAAYHPLLTKIPVEFVEKQIILNEYALGYFFGRRQGFEGEASVMIRDLTGFFPPELAVNRQVLQIVDELAYSWILVDEAAVSPRRCGVYGVEGMGIKIVARNSPLSNLLSFKRDLVVGDFVDLLKHCGSSVVALDAEFFGRHHKQGIYLFELLTEALSREGIEVVTVSDFVAGAREEAVADVMDSTWAKEDLWASNSRQQELWNILSYVLAHYKSDFNKKDVLGLENVAIWDKTAFAGREVATVTELEALYARCVHSDQFWWLSGKQIAETLLDDPSMAARALDIYAKIAQATNDKVLEDMISSARFQKSPGWEPSSQ